VNDNIPGFNAPMTIGQKLSLVGMAAAFLMNVIAFILLVTGHLGL
jgi:hypothetical protein